MDMDLLTRLLYGDDSGEVDQDELLTRLKHAIASKSNFQSLTHQGFARRSVIQADPYSSQFSCRHLCANAATGVRKQQRG